MIDATHNPWTAVLDQLWFVLETDAIFAAVVQPGNRIKFDKQNPFKDTKQNADCPEVIIEPVTGQEGQAFTSLAAKTQQHFSIQITTLDLRLTNADGTGAAFQPLCGQRSGGFGHGFFGDVGPQHLGLWP